VPPAAPVTVRRSYLSSQLLHRPVLRVTVATVVLGGVAVWLGQALSLNNALTLEEALGLAVFAIATNLLLGTGGLVSFGQAAFYGCGAYLVALSWLHHWMPFWVAFFMSPLVGAVVAFLMGLIALRTRRLYFALLTLAFSELFYQLVNVRYDFTKGATGIFSVSMIPASLASPRTGYEFTVAVVAVSLLVLWKVTNSPFGLALRACRENRERAEALGINVYRQQLLAFVISGAFCSLAGALFVVYGQSAYPDLLNWTESGQPLFMAVIGGMFSFLGPGVGAILYQFGYQYISQHTHDWELVLGTVLVVTVLFRPDGLAGLVSPATWRRRWSRRRRSPEPPEASMSAQQALEKATR
jgi:branched-chain amino acid transport system permease protein